jgi:hypothetical protein
VLGSANLRARFLRVYPRLRAILRRAAAPSFLLACEGPWGGVDHTTLPLCDQDSSHRVLGRHTACDVFLGKDPSLSLRHLLASAWLDAEGTPQLRVLDLGGEVKMRLHNGTQSAGFRTDGPCVASLGASALFLLLVDGREWPDDPHEAWDLLAAREVLEQHESRNDTEFIRTVRPRLRLVRPAPEAILSGSDDNSTLIVQLAAPSELLELPPDSPGAIGYLTLPGDRFVRLSPSDLARGVLVGRYERCELGGALFSDANTVSRVHLCLALDPTGLWAIDTCSTNGTWHEGNPIQAIKVGASATFTLGGQPLTWQLHH